MNYRFFLLLALISGMAAGSSTAAAGGRPVAAQNRVHVGGAWTPGGTQVTGGLNSRMTQSISVDVGGVLSPTDAADPELEDHWVLRHGLFVTPGIRVPHRNKSEIKWDLILRAGFGPVWVADAEVRFDTQINPGLVGGADLMLRFKKWGLRIENRVWHMKPFSRYQQVEVATLRPQIGASAQYEF
ncbi:MAG: hypothetical protein H8D71_00665 [Deltaproteobacteria bacterium]|nr:hypothetical protein [Deltaproteobacteria bacterium]